MHLDDERIERLLHGELGPAEAETRLHLAQCTACRDRLEEAREEEGRIFTLLSHADHPLPIVDPRMLLAGRGSSAGQWGRRAAVILFGAVLAGVAYAAPGSPLPAVVERVFGIGPAAEGRAPAEQIATEGRSPEGAGIAVVPDDGLVIRLVALDHDGTATVQLTDGEEVVVRAVEGKATFSSDPGRLTVSSGGGARLEILIPKAARSVEVRADTALVFRKLAEGPVTKLPRDPVGRYTIPLRPPPP